MKQHHLLQRQSLITAHITAYKQSQLQALQCNLDDPFQTYYYPTAISDPSSLHNIEQELMLKIQQQQNINKMGQIQEQLQQQMYCLEQIIQKQSIEQQYMQAVIKSMQDKIACLKLSKQVKKYNREQTKWMADSACQSEIIKRKDSSIQCQINSEQQKIQQKSKYKKHLFNLPAYSITIQSYSLQSQPKDTLSLAIPIMSSKKSEAKDSAQIFKVKQAIPQKQHQPSNININMDMHDEINMKAVHKQLKKQMQYLQHLEYNKNRSNNNKKQYKMQKAKVKYLMEMFWKSTNIVNDDDSNIQLPLLDATTL